MKNRWHAPAACAILAALAGCNTLDLTYETYAQREARIRSEILAESCERNLSLHPIRSKDQAKNWLSSCAGTAKPAIVESVRNAYDRHATAECRNKAEAAKSVADLDRAKQQCSEYLDDPQIQAAMGRRGELETNALAAELDAIGVGAEAYRYQDFMNRHKSTPADNPVIARAALLFKTRTESERLLAAEQQRKARATAHENAVSRHRNMIAFCKDTIRQAEAGILQEQQVGQLSGYVNATRMNFLGRAIVECRDQIEASKAELAALEKDPKRTVSGQPPAPPAISSGRRVQAP